MEADCWICITLLQPMTHLAGTSFAILHKDVGLLKRSAWWVPKRLFASWLLLPKWSRTRAGVFWARSSRIILNFFDTNHVPGLPLWMQIVSLVPEKVSQRSSPENAWPGAWCSTGTKLLFTTPRKSSSFWPKEHPAASPPSPLNLLTLSGRLFRFPHPGKGAGEHDHCPLRVSIVGGTVMRIWICLDPYHFPGSGSFPVVLGSRSVSYSNEHNKIKCKRKFKNVCLLVGSWQTYWLGKSS